MTLMLYAAASLSLCTYASVGIREGTIYEGRARIVGYDTSIYETNDGEATRMDLEVAWGGDWGWYVFIFYYLFCLFLSFCFGFLFHCVSYKYVHLHLSLF